MAVLELFVDQRTKVASYPKFQEYFRMRRPPLLAVWGRHDLIFLPAGAEVFRLDIPIAEVHLYETGHSAPETHATEIGAVTRGSLGRNIAAQS